ncbi:MAG: LOG family protein [Rhodospirillales bacterium]|nr:LOG family protein [Rhodospirillales bacterium]
MANANNKDDAKTSADVLKSADERLRRMIAEFTKPHEVFENAGVSDTLVMFGSARFLSPEQAEEALATAEENGGDLAIARRDLDNSRYYEAARTLSRRLTEWAKSVNGGEKRFVVCSGGGPGIMEAANRGATDAGGPSIGLNITLPHEQNENAFITKDLSLTFHYFFMRKFWFVYLAKAVIIFPGGFGTMDELFEVLTLDQTGKLAHPLPVVLFGMDYWGRVLNLDAMIEAGTIREEDLALCLKTDSVDEAFDFLIKELSDRAIERPGGDL